MDGQSDIGQTSHRERNNNNNINNWHTGQIEFACQVCWLPMCKWVWSERLARQFLVVSCMCLIYRIGCKCQARQHKKLRRPAPKATVASGKAKLSIYISSRCRWKSCQMEMQLAFNASKNGFVCSAVNFALFSFESVAGFMANRTLSLDDIARSHSMPTSWFPTWSQLGALLLIAKRHISL